MDLTKSIEPNSEQVNAEDLLTGPRTVTVTSVESGSTEQPVFVHLEEFPGRTYRPSKSMRRVLVTAWGVDSRKYTGRTLTLFRNPKIRFGKEEVGGIQISHLSDINGPLTIALTVSRGKRAPFIVEPLDPPKPLKDESGRDWLEELSQADGDPSAIEALGKAAATAHALPATIAVIRAAYKESKVSQ